MGCPLTSGSESTGPEPPSVFRPLADFATDAILCPYPIYATLRSQGPATWLPEVSAFVVTRYADIAEVNRQPGVFSSGVATGPRPVPLLLQEHFNEVRRSQGRPERPVQLPDPILLTADPPLHTRHRSLLSRAFSPRRIAAIEQRISELSDDLLRPLLGAASCEFVSNYAVPLPLTLIAEILGCRSEDLPKFKGWSDDFSGTFGAAEPSTERLKEIAQTAFEFEQYFRDRITERRAEPRDDLLSDVINARVEGQDPLTDDEILGMFAQVLIAGNETTTMMLTQSIRYLGEQPVLVQELRERPDRIPAFVDEVLRLESPIQGFWRRALVDTRIGSTDIPADSIVLILYGSGNRDPDVFPSPDEVHLDRAGQRPNLAFGLGAHYCIGAHLARTEGRIAVEQILRACDVIELDHAQPLQPVPSFLLHGLTSLHVRFGLAASPTPTA